MHEGLIFGSAPQPVPTARACWYQPLPWYQHCDNFRLQNCVMVTYGKYSYVPVCTSLGNPPGLPARPPAPAPWSHTSTLLHPALRQRQEGSCMGWWPWCTRPGAHRARLLSSADTEYTLNLTCNFIIQSCCLIRFSSVLYNQLLSLPP